ncbi:hypothetical protein midi_00983 [Candidatus Midichloria mitochondrii IricVA]|uniref:Uncharacterized protein n=2 Tax=Candidatus Midichloria mitochondrii TaxID=234827 RepID=F7XTQ4_MIDMI|nr:hypothetical protein midi_00983 [Candidatus Midichloria mitochondrii IricVA]
MRDAVIPLVILLNCCKGKQTGTLTQQKAGRFVITYVLAVIRSLRHRSPINFLADSDIDRTFIQPYLSLLT